MIADANICACGCGRATRPATQTDRRKGLIKGQPTRCLTGHRIRPPRPQPVAAPDGSLVLPLRCGVLVQLDAADWPRLAGYGWYLGRHGYVVATARIAGRKTVVLMQRIITDAPPHTEVDHLSGDKLDNRRSNLRVTTSQLNQVNRRHMNRNNTSGVRGVTSCGSRWHARICVARRTRFLGSFEDKVDAVRARRSAELRFWGEQCPVPAGMEEGIAC
jgi:HNH endonuclease